VKIAPKINLIQRVIRAIYMLRQMLHDPVMAATITLISIVQMFAFTTVYFVLALSMQLPVPRWQYATNLLRFLPARFLSGAGGGREAIIVFSMSDLCPVTTVQSAALSIAFGVIIFVSSLSGAILWMMRPSMRKSIRREVEQK
jgi:hypothetical protein